MCSNWLYFKFLWKIHIHFLGLFSVSILQKCFLNRCLVIESWLWEPILLMYNYKSKLILFFFTSITLRIAHSGQSSTSPCLQNICSIPSLHTLRILSKALSNLNKSTCSTYYTTLKEDWSLEFHKKYVCWNHGSWNHILETETMAIYFYMVRTHAPTQPTSYMKYDRNWTLYSSTYSKTPKDPNASFEQLDVHPITNSDCL